MHDAAQRMLVHDCVTCKGSFDEGTVDAVQAAPKARGEAITPAMGAALAA